MENHDNVGQWVEEKMAALEPKADWQPDRARAMARLREKDGRARGSRRRWIWVASTAALLCAVALFVPRHAACASCTLRFGVAPAVQLGAFKALGSERAAVVCEVYTDYECPACAAWYRDTFPLLKAAYVDTGKVRLIHRDFPLKQHRYARLAARYANAAGELGQYEIVSRQIFLTQAWWRDSGDVDSAVAKVLAPSVMEKVRSMVGAGDASLEADVARGVEDHLTQTPSLVIVAGGNRQVVPGNVSYGLLKSYLDSVIR